jgi:hypothetical protein
MPILDLQTMQGASDERTLQAASTRSICCPTPHSGLSVCLCAA